MASGGCLPADAHTGRGVGFLYRLDDAASSQRNSRTLSVVGLTLAACAMFAAGFFLINRAAVYITACPCINEEGVRAGFGMYMA